MYAPLPDLAQFSLGKSVRKKTKYLSNVSRLGRVVFPSSMKVFGHSMQPLYKSVSEAALSKLIQLESWSAYRYWDSRNRLWISCNTNWLKANRYSRRSMNSLVLQCEFFYWERRKEEILNIDAQTLKKCENLHFLKVWCQIQLCR